MINLPTDEQLIKGTHTITFRHPWIVKEAILKLDELIQPQFKVLEFGSGGSTLFYEDRCKEVITYDTDEYFIELVQSNLKQDGIVTINHIKDLDVHDKYNKEYFDILVIDSHPTITNRLELLKEYLPYLKKGGILVLDNYGTENGGCGLGNYRYEEVEIIGTFNNPMWNGNGTRICKKK